MSRRLLIHAPDAEARRDLAFAEANPAMIGEPDSDLAIEVARIGAFFRADLPGQAAAEGSIAYVARRILEAQTRYLADESAGGPVLYGASVVAGHSRTLLIGPPGPLRTDLLLHLLVGAFSVEGEGCLSVRGANVTAWPQRLWIRSSPSRTRIPLWEQVLRSPSLPDWHGEPIYAFAPSRPGQAWRICSTSVDHIVILTENEGGRSMLRRLSTGGALGKILNACRIPRAGRAATIASLAGLLATAENFELAIGGAEPAAMCLTHGIGGR